VNTRSGELTEAAPKADDGGSGFTRVDGEGGLYRRAQGGGSASLRTKTMPSWWGRGMAGVRRGVGGGVRRPSANGDARAAGCGQCVDATCLGHGPADVAHRD
jgi:hypothetical protein